MWISRSRNSASRIPAEYVSFATLTSVPAAVPNQAYQRAHQDRPFRGHLKMCLYSTPHTLKYAALYLGDDLSDGNVDILTGNLPGSSCALQILFTCIVVNDAKPLVSQLRQRLQFSFSLTMISLGASGCGKSRLTAIYRAILTDYLNHNMATYGRHVGCNPIGHSESAMQ
ncbi:hypothetical protein DFH27DRAFT_583105 [Peziza echinospora]|nr:hypothetical protein DFH27DRAFT_583105 [Peziza echinospora]